MKNILVIESSPKAGASFSNKLVTAIVEKLKAQSPNAEVKSRDLSKHATPHLEEAHLAAFFTPVEKHTSENLEAVRHSNEIIGEIKHADVIVIGVPMYNFSIPSALKAWIDHAVRVGQTFQYTENGPEGLLSGKKLYLAISSGGIYSEGPMKAYDFTENYLRTVFGFIGIKEVAAFRVEGLAIPGVKDTALEKAIGSIRV